MQRLALIAPAVSLSRRFLAFFPASRPGCRLRRGLLSWLLRVLRLIQLSHPTSSSGSSGRKLIHRPHLANTTAYFVRRRRCNCIRECGVFVVFSGRIRRFGSSTHLIELIQPASSSSSMGLVTGGSGSSSRVLHIDRLPVNFL
jgi:hypothetical protein